MSLEQIISEVFSIPLASVDSGLLFESIGSWDSLSHMILIVRIEEQYGVQFEGEEIADMRSLAAAREALKNHGVTV